MKHLGAFSDRMSMPKSIQLHSLNPDFSEHKHSQHPVLSVVRYIKMSSTLRTLLVAHRLMFFLAASEIKSNLYLMSRNVNTRRVHLTTEHLARPVLVKNLLKQASYIAWKSWLLL